jgi:hypothetical protein
MRQFDKQMCTTTKKQSAAQVTNGMPLVESENKQNGISMWLFTQQ